MIDVNPDQIKIVARILAEHVPEFEVRSFGSRVTQTAKDDSDLDLVVVGERALDINAFSRLKEAFEEADLPFRVNVLDWHTAGPAFVKVIEKKYEVVQKGRKKSPGMAGEWRRVAASDIASQTRNALVGGPFGSNLGSKDYAENGIPVIRGKNMGERWLEGHFAYVTPAKAKELSANLARPGDIIFTQRGTLGQVSLVPEEPYKCYLISQSQMKLSVDKKVADSLYFYYVFRSQEQQEYISKHTIQTGVPHTNLGILRSTLIPLPPLSEQRAIAHILGALDDKIELNQQMNETLEAMARALFKSWFVDFDPVRAKAEGRNPGLPKPLAALFPDSFEDSELGEIPKGWEVSQIGVIADVVDCLHSKKPERLDKGMPLLQLSNIRDDGLIDMKDSYFIDALDYRKWVSRMEATPGDCMITNVGRVGAVAQMPFGQKAALGRNMTGVRCKEEFPFPTILIECLLSQAMREEVVRRMDTGTILDAINVRNIPGLRFVRSRDIEVPKQFEHVARPLRAQMERHVAESCTLAALRDTLLPKLISGELRVKDAEAIAGIA